MNKFIKQLFTAVPTSVSIRKLVIGTIGVILCSTGIFLLIFRIPYLEVNSADFKQDYYAAQKLLSGQSIYSDQSHGNNHPPFVAVLITPFAFLSYKNAIILWSIISVILYCLIGWIVVNELNIDLSIEWKLIITGLALCWYQFHAHIALGQLSILISFLMIGAWVLMRQNKEIAAGVLIGLAISIKLFPGLILIYLVIKQRWRCALSAISTVFVLCALVIMWTGIDDFIWFFTEVTPKNAEAWVTFPPNISIGGSVAKFFLDGPWVQPIINSPESAQALTLGLTIILLIFLVNQIHKMPKSVEGTDIAFSINVLAMIIVSPIAWQHSFPLLALPLGILLARLQREPHIPTLRVMLLIVLMISLPDYEIGRALMAFYAPYRMPWYAALIFLIPTMSLLIIWPLVVRTGVKSFE
jgi:hypothetical protein